MSTRINTNVSSLIAQKTLARSNEQLQTALTRLSTGLRINVGKDDPAGLIASEALRSDIVSVQRGITNSERASQLIATADSALGQVSTLLNDIRGLVSEAANVGALSEDQIRANQLQVDSSLEAIDRISQTTSFQGRRLLDGSLDFLTTSAGTVDTRASGTVSTITSTNAAGSISSTTDAQAVLTLTGSGTGAVTFSAVAAGADGNGIGVRYVAGNSGAGASASYDGTNRELTITLNSGSTAADVLSAVAANGSASAAVSTTVATGGTILSAGAGASGSTAGGVTGNEITISASTVGSQYNNLTVALTDSVATGAETASYDTASNTLTVSKAANSTASQIADAINASGVFSATASGTGTGVYTAQSISSATTGGVTGNAFVLSATIGGAAYNDVNIVMTDSASSTGAETASYDTGTNTLTIQKAANSTVDQIAAAITANGVFNATAVAGDEAGVFTAQTLSGVTTGGTVGSAAITGLQIDQANFGTASSIDVQIDIDAQATRGSLIYSGGALATDLVLQIGGKSGFEVFNFGAGTTTDQIRTALNLVRDATGVEAVASGAGIELRSVEYGADAFVSAKALTGSFNVLNSNLQTVTRSEGTDVAVRINGVQATGRGLQASLNTSTLDLSFTLNANAVSGDSYSFSVTGGGAIFQLGPDVVSNQQARIGLQGVSSATLGGTSGTLFELRSGGAKDLFTDTKGAAKVVDEVITAVTSLRGRLGAFQKTTLETNINSLRDTLENLSAAESSIRDADYANESAALTRAQILVKAGTSVLQIANSNPQNVLSLLGG